MKILIYSSVFYPAIGGIENHTLFLAREFVRAGHQVKVVTEQSQTGSTPLENIEIFHSADRLSQIRLFLWSDIFYMPNITLKGIWLLVLNPLKRWMISHNDFHIMESLGFKTRLKSLVIRKATTNISVSRSVAKALPVSSTVIYNCYNDELFKLYDSESRTRDFVFVGRLVTQKGCDMLIEACGRLRGPFTLSIVGYGPEAERLQARVRALGLAEQVTFLGMLRDEPLARVMNRHRTMIVPSTGKEGFGIVALEGLACGCRMLVADAGGLPEAVDRHAEVFPMGDVDALTALMQAALDSPAPDPMSEGRSAYLREHSKRDVARKYLDVFSRAPSGVALELGKM
jgi:glycogen synthase